MKALAVALVLTGCVGGLDSDGLGGDDGGSGGSPCHLNLVFDPTTPVAGPETTIRVSAVTFDIPGVLDYSWHVTRGGTSVVVAVAQDDHSQIDFQAPVPGIYLVSLDISGSGSPGQCNSSSVPITVRARGARSTMYRLRVVPPPSVAAPPLEQKITVDGVTGAQLGTVGLELGTLVHPGVSGPGGGVPAYLRFAPVSAPDAFVEGFADASGHVDAQLLPEPHTVLIVPSSAGSVPRRITGWTPSSMMFGVDAGTPISGTVRDPADAPLAGAMVQLLIDGVPSTLATTAGDGSFTLRAVPVAAAAVTVEVTPPNASGLPRLSATSQGFDLGASLQVRYAADLVRKDLAGIQVQRQGVPLAGATVMVVGALPGAGTVTAGTSASARGDVRISARTLAGGTLPGMLVPSDRSLSTVTTVAAGDIAVDVLDTTSTLPSVLEAQAMQSKVIAVQGPSAVDLRGAVLDLVPIDALAMAAAPTLHVTAGTSGNITAVMAYGGHYDLRFHDPAGRVAPFVVADRASSSVAATYRLPAGVLVQGHLMVGGTQVLANASVRILCDGCGGIERERPIAEVASDENGQFTLVVPDPGTVP